MKKFWLMMSLIGIFCIVGVLPAFAQEASEESSLVYITFDKSAVSANTWEGTSGADIVSDLTAIVHAVDVYGPIWFITEMTFELVIDGEPTLISVTGTLDTRSGQAFLMGEVTDGMYSGAVVYATAQQVDAATGRMQGQMLLIPTDTE